MAQVEFPENVRLTGFHVEPWNPGQVALTSPFTGTTQVLNRAPASWRGSVSFAAVDRQDEQAAGAIEAFFASLNGQENWCAIPFLRPTIKRPLTITSATHNSAGRIGHDFAATPLKSDGFEPGRWLQANGRAFIIQWVSKPPVTQLRLEPQIILAEGVNLEPITTMRVQAQSGQGALTRRSPDFWGPWQLNWVEHLA